VWEAKRIREQGHRKENETMWKARGLWQQEEQGGQRVVAAGRARRPEGCGSRKNREARGMQQLQKHG